MRDIFPAIETWLQDPVPFALARVTKTWGSSPRPVGSVMAIRHNQEMVGSVSGGCVEGAVLRAAKDVLQTKQAQALSFGVSNDEAWAVGLTCGGKVDVWLEPFWAFDPAAEAAWLALHTAFTEKIGVIWVTKLGPHATHTLVYQDGHQVGPALSPELIKAALKAYESRSSQVWQAETDTYFIQVIAPPKQIVITGAAHLTAELVALAKPFDFHITVIDPREVFTQQTQFQVMPDHLLSDYPAEVLPEMRLDDHTFAVLLAHDPKIDDQALELLLRSKVAYIGALGGKKSQARRRERLQVMGFTEAEIDRIHGPIGLDIGAKTAQEIALSILAEIIQVDRGKAA